MKSLSVSLAIALCLLGGACSKAAEPAGPVAGRERSACKPDHTCDPALVCLSEVCVVPPQANCQAVGERVASYELGNYAPPETRAPVIAKHVAACQALHVTQEQAACLAEATDRWSSATCVPALFPGVTSTPGDCEPVIAKFRLALTQDQLMTADPTARAIMDRMFTQLDLSCRDDHWPDELKACIRAAAPTSQGLDTCRSVTDPELTRRISERLATAMQP
jgi:hypothetical protein